jgi:hypothetical protein
MHALWHGYVITVLIAMIVTSPAGQDATATITWRVFAQHDAVYGRAIPGGNASDIVFLGTFDASAHCEAALVDSSSNRTASAGRLQSGTWFDTQYSKHGKVSRFAGQCFGVIGPEWAPHCCEKGVISWWSGATPAPFPPCSSTANCSYNGACVQGICHCNPPWKGDSCSELDRLPAQKGTGYHRQESGRNLSSWGGAVLQFGTEWRMWVSEMVGHCGINAWSRNSQVVLATSSDPLTQPFVKQSIFSPVFSHEPDAIRGPNGEVVVILTHATSLPTPGPGGPICTTCADGSTPGSCGKDESYGPVAKAGRAFPTLLSFAAGPSSKFSEPLCLFNGTAGVARHGTYGDTNLAGIILPNGTFIGIWRECTRSPPSSATVHPVRATDWKNAETFDWSTAPLFTNLQEHSPPPEDPFVYGPDDTGVFHALFHDRSCEGCGGHGWSIDGVRWHYTGIAYNGSTEFTDGSLYYFQRRERPHLVFAEHHGGLNYPIALTNGIEYGDGDATSTLLQPLRTPPPPLPLQPMMQPGRSP